MPFYTFNTSNLPEYPEKSEEFSLEVKEKENKEISFNLSESFFQIPPSLTDDKRADDQSTVFCIPETQCTPAEIEDELIVNVTADQSVLLPSISSVLEASARSALNHRRKSGHFQAPVHQRVADKLEMPSQNPNSPLLKATMNGNSISMDLTEDSLLLALNSSVILCDEKASLNVNQDYKMAKFSLDFLNTPPLKSVDSVTTTEEFGDRVPTQVLIQNLGGDDDTQLAINQEISLLSIGGDNEKLFDLLPNTPQDPERINEIIEEVEEGHDAIFFPNSFDEGDNPFLNANNNLTTIDESMEQVQSKEHSPESVKPPSNFEARLRSTTSPPQDFLTGPKRIVLSARKTSVAKPAPLSIKSSKSLVSLTDSLQTSSSMSRAVSVESVPVPEPIKKSLGARLKRVAQLTRTPQTTEPSATPMTPVKVSSIEEEKYLNHMLKTENKRISTIIAEPRRTPIAGLKTSKSLLNSPALRSSKTSVNETPSKNRPATPNRMKEASLASYYTDLILSSPCPNPETPQKANVKDSIQDSPDVSNASASLDSRSNLYFKEGQWVFFGNNSLSNYLVGSIVIKTSKTRDNWKIKQSNGTEFTVSGLEMCPIAFLRPNDELFLRNPKKSGNEFTGPFKFKRFSPQNSFMIELLRESAGQLYDCLKLTRVAIEKETFLKVRDRFSRGCIEDSQIRDQIMNFNDQEIVPENSVSIQNSSKIKAKKRSLLTDNNLSEGQSVSATPSQKRSRQQKIFQDFKFLITTGDNTSESESKEKYTKLIESLGGEVLTNLPSDPEVPLFKTYLLSNGFKRTPKYMTAIIRGVPRVYFNWIESCCAQGCFIEPFNSFLIDPKSECKPTGLLFKSKKFFVSGSSKFKNSWVTVIRLLGGTVSNAPSSNTIVLTEGTEKGVKGQVEKFVDVDWLINCIVTKKFT